MESMEATPFDPVPEVVAAVARGETVIVVDDEGRENEGDLICAAECTTPETINFMATHGRGLVCVAMDAERLSRLGLSRMSQESGDRFRTAWMESVDARDGITTGISAYDRAHTVRLLADEGTRATDLVRPGHVFPLEAKAGGVLDRAGHTESAVDLMRLAGKAPVGVICEVLRDDGHMARTPELLAFKQRRGLKMTSVAALVRHRRTHERLVEMERDVMMPTKAGLYRLKMFFSKPDNKHHLAMVMENQVGDQLPLVRVHSECLTGDVLGSLRCDCGEQLRASLHMIAEYGYGAVVYMRQEGRGIGLAHKIHAYQLQEEGLDTVQANEELGFEADLRDYSMSAQILKELGMPSVRLITNNPEKVSALTAYGIHVAERVPLVPEKTEYNERYLETKKEKMGHLI